MPIWGWACVGLVVVAVLLLVYANIADRREQAWYEREADDVVGWIVQANTDLYSSGGTARPAQVLVAFDDTLGGIDTGVGELAARVAQLKQGKPRTDDEKEVAKLVRDESYRPFQRFRLPPGFTGGREVYSMHVWVVRSLLPDGVLQHPFIRCLVFTDRPDTRPRMRAYLSEDDEYRH